MGKNEDKTWGVTVAGSEQRGSRRIQVLHGLKSIRREKEESEVGKGGVGYS